MKLEQALRLGAITHLAGNSVDARFVRVIYIVDSMYNSVTKGPFWPRRTGFPAIHVTARSYQAI